MKKGFAFLHFEDLVSIISREFKDTISEGWGIPIGTRMSAEMIAGLASAERAFPERVAQDERISAFMQNLPRQYIDRFSSRLRSPLSFTDSPCLARRDWSKVTQNGRLNLQNINEV